MPDRVLRGEAQPEGVVDRLQEIGCVAILETELTHARL